MLLVQDYVKSDDDNDNDDDVDDDGMVMMVKCIHIPLKCVLALNTAVIINQPATSLIQLA
jgi:hypothetical protein